MLRLVVFSAVLAVAFAVFNGDPKQASILRSDNEITPEGNYQYAYETDNGIAAQESGQGAVAAQGNYQWQSPEGENVQVQYIADENGYHPQGTHIPTPPPVPAAIARALEWIAAHPQPVEQQQQVVRRRYQ